MSTSAKQMFKHAKDHMPTEDIIHDLDGVRELATVGILPVHHCLHHTQKDIISVSYHNDRYLIIIIRKSRALLQTA